MKTDIYHTTLSRYLIMGIIVVLAGGYWNLDWLLALPVIMLFFPLLIAVATYYLFTRESFGQKAGICALTVVATVIIRNLLYISFGQGLDYLLHDGETQLAAIILLVEQLFLSVAVLAVLTWSGRRR